MSVQRLLVDHPDTPCDAVRRLAVEASWPGRTTLAWRYALEGDLEGLCIPPEGPSLRADKLWQHTCFEAFVAAQGAAGYIEFNFAPSMQWAAYSFSAYRHSMTPAELARPPRLAVRREHASFVLDASVELDTLSLLRERTVLRLALSAVIEDAHGHLSYWALRHPPGKPDFHHAAGFDLVLTHAAGPSAGN
jgi:hypothetical protein